MVIGKNKMYAKREFIMHHINKILKNTKFYIFKITPYPTLN